MMKMNKVVLVGRMVADMEIKTNTNGKEFGTFALAVTRDYKNANGEYDADFIPVIVNGSTVKFVSQYCHKGDALMVDGSLRVTTRKDNEGHSYTNFGVNAQQVELFQQKQGGATPAQA